KINPNFIDLKDNYDFKLLERFYQELVIPNFPNEHELEPLENWVEMFNDNEDNLNDDNSNNSFGYHNSNKIISDNNINNYNNSNYNINEDEDSLIFIGSTNNEGSATYSSSYSNNIIMNNGADIYTTATNSECSDEDDRVDFHILLAICPPEHVIPGQSNILGGIVFEYYPSINCGCITYLLVNTNYRGQGFAAILLKEASSRLMENGKTRGHLSGCNAIFLETNSAEKVKPEDDVMDPAKRHAIFYKLGIRLLDFDYIQPPLSNESGKCKDLLLTCLLTPTIPKQVFGKEERYYLPSSLLLNFLRVFWASCYSRLENKDWEQDVDFRRMMDQLNRREKIPLLDLPWNRPWTLLDLRDSFDSKQLITKFYNQVLVPNYPGINELEPLDVWFKMLPTSSEQQQQKEQKQKQQDTQLLIDNEDFHLLVALRYHEDEDTSKQEPIICGGLAFEYHKETNCGLLTYFLVGDGPNNRSENMARALIQRAVDILEQNAIDCGNLAGCNAIFLESNEVHRDLPSNDTGKSSVDAAIKTNKCNTIETNITEISYKKEFLFNMGWRKLDIQYVQPPLSTENIKSKSLNLLVLITPRIPQLNIGTEQYYYLPNTLINSFIVSFWESTSKRNHNCHKLANWYERDHDYMTMLDSISRRERIPLIDSLEQWKTNQSISIIDLAVDYHQDLFNEFYNCLPQDIDIESREQLEQLLKHSSSVTTYQSKSSVSRRPEDIHILLAVSYFDQNKTTPTILGSSIFSYLLNSNCGIITNVLTHQNNILSSNLLQFSKDPQENRMIDTILLNESVEIINIISKSKTHISGPNTIFLEALKSTSGSKVCEVSNADKLIQLPFSFEIQNLGWNIVDINYYKPPRSNNTLNNSSSSLSILCALQTEQIPKLDDLTTFYIPRELLRAFIKSYWATLFTRNQISIEEFSKSETNTKMNQQTKSRDKFLLLD
ncbi:hypothetical protein DICPUDRAFT_5127, partial [Dictyostelium purpureum]